MPSPSPVAVGETEVAQPRPRTCDRERAEEEKYYDRRLSSEYNPPCSHIGERFTFTTDTDCRTREQADLRRCDSKEDRGMCGMCRGLLYDIKRNDEEMPAA